MPGTVSRAHRVFNDAQLLIRIPFSICLLESFLSLSWEGSIVIPFDKRGSFLSRVIKVDKFESRAISSPAISFFAY